MGTEQHDQHKDIFRKVELPDLCSDGRLPTTPLEDSRTTRNATVEMPRSTYDPFQINFATVSLVEKLQSRHAGRKQRMWAWLVLVLPRLLIGLFATMLIWSLPNRYGRDSVSHYLLLFIGTGIAWTPAAFWLFVMYRKRRQ